jgi:hypothetical protein
LIEGAVNSSISTKGGQEGEQKDSKKGSGNEEGASNTGHQFNMAAASVRCPQVVVWQAG